MRRYLLIALLLVSCASPPSFDGPAESPNTVTIEARRDSRRPPRRSLGFVVESEGYVLSTYELLTDRRSERLLPDVQVTVREEGEGGTYPATIVGVEPTLNLAILRIEADQRFRPSKVQREIPLEAGLKVFAPTKLDGRDAGITAGTLAGLNTKECYQESLTETMVRAEIAIPRAAVGAPIYDESGTVVALHTGYEPHGLKGHAEEADEMHLLPIVLAFNIYDSIKEKQSFRSPWTGFSVRPLTRREQSQFPTDGGYRGGIAIEYVWENSPAEKLGIREGDILMQFLYHRITSPADFQKWLYKYGVGQDVKMVLLRDGEQYRVDSYVIEERPEWAKPR